MTLSKPRPRIASTLKRSSTMSYVNCDGRDSNQERRNEDLSKMAAPIQTGTSVRMTRSGIGEIDLGMARDVLFSEDMFSSGWNEKRGRPPTCRWECPEFLATVIGLAHFSCYKLDRYVTRLRSSSPTICCSILRSNIEVQRRSLTDWISYSSRLLPGTPRAPVVLLHHGEGVQEAYG